MTAKALIIALQQMPPDAEVNHLWDGEARTGIQFVWLARDGSVVTSDYGQTCYSEETRPVDAPSKKENRYWSTPENPHDEDGIGGQAEPSIVQANLDRIPEERV